MVATALIAASWPSWLLLDLVLMSAVPAAALHEIHLPPNIRRVMVLAEAFAREGMAFRNAYTQSSDSSSADLCPLSSDYALRARESYVYPGTITYPRVLIDDVLKALGYRTAAISSQNDNRGGLINFLFTGGVDFSLHSENYVGSTYVPSRDVGFTGFIAGSRRSGKIDDRLTAGEAISWIDHPDRRPFFI